MDVTLGPWRSCLLLVSALVHVVFHVCPCWCLKENYLWKPLVTIRALLRLFVTVAVVVLAAEVWTVPKWASWNMWAAVTLPVGAVMGRLRTRGCIVVSVRCKDSPEHGAWSRAGERCDAVASLVANEAEERADETGWRRPMCWQC
jgi:hypothetical protein